MNKSKKRKEPDWSRRAEYMSHKPDWVDKIPRRLWELGKVFFPIPPKMKGWNYAHHMDENRYEADSEMLNAYFEQGWGYGIACAGDLAVIDVDHDGFLNDVTENLPQTVWQMSGSREGYHLFYRAEGLDTRVNLSVVIDARDHVATHGLDEEYPIERLVGEIKCDPHGYVVGPGSLHPSGNIYGPLKGKEIKQIDPFYILDAVYFFDSSNYSEVKDKIQRDRRGLKESKNYGRSKRDYEDRKSSHEFYKLDADDVLPWLEPNKRISHPVHGSSTDSNFMKNDDRETFTCWRCNFGAGPGCGINAQQLLTLFAIGNNFGKYACEYVRGGWRTDSTLHYHAWKEAVKENLVPIDDPPYTVIKGFLVNKGVIDEDETVPDIHYSAEELKYETFVDLREEVLK